MNSSKAQYLWLYRLTACLVIALPILADVLWFEQVIVSLVYVPLTCLALAFVAKMVDVQFASYLLQDHGRQMKFKLLSFPKRKVRAKNLKKRSAA